MSSTVLVAAITNGRSESTLAFCTMLLRLQGTAASSPGTKLTIQFFGSLNDAFTYFLKDASFDVVVCIETWKACDPQFILEPPPEGMPFVVGAYPLPSIDWERVKTSIAVSSEAPHLVGHKYNVVVHPSPPDRKGVRYVPVASAELGIFKMRRCVLDEIVAKHGRSVLENDGMRGQRIFALWKKDVYVDLEATCTSFGPVGYMGCVGLRKTLR